MFVSGSESLGNSVPVYCSGLTSFDVRSWKISCKNFQGLLSIVQLSMFFFVVAFSCDSFYIISNCFMFVNNFFYFFFAVVKQFLTRQLIQNSIFIKACQQLFDFFLQFAFFKVFVWIFPYSCSNFYAKLFIFHPLCLCMPLLSLCLDQRTYGILPRLSGIVNVVFIFCAIQNILTSF